MVQLGDLAHGDFKSGSRASMKYARQLFDSFGAPKALIVGNHDLEGEFDDLKSR